MTPNIRNGLLASGFFFVIACLAWFFSSRPRLFIRTFVRPDELRQAARAILRNPKFKRSTRFIAILQFAVAAALLVWTLVAWRLG